MEIKLAKQSNISSLAQLDREANLTPWTREEYQESFNSPNQFIYIATHSNKIIGCLVYNIVLDEAEILQFWIIKDLQNKGYGTQFLNNFLLKIIHLYKVEKVFLEVRDSNKVALRLYQSLGFNQVGVRNNYYQVDGWQFDAIIMLKHLK